MRMKSEKTTKKGRRKEGGKARDRTNNKKNVGKGKKRSE